MAYYKAFKRGMICNGKQYAENADFEEQGAKSCCQAGVMHFCENPMDVLNYYPLVDENGDFSEFATVEPLDKVIKKEDKCASKKIHIGAKLGFKGFIEAAVNVLIEKTKPENKNDAARIGSSGDAARIGSSGEYARIGSSGYAAQIGSSGYAARIGSSGKYAQIGSSGDNARIKCEADHSVVVCAGKRAKVKAHKGTWITLAEYGEFDGEGYPCICVKSAQIDGETLKCDTWYTLENGEFVEAD